MTTLDHIHKTVPRLVHDDYSNSFREILEIWNEKTLHQKNLEHLTKDMWIC